MLATWPEREGAVMVENDAGGTSELTGVWAWKLETLKPGETATVTYALDGLEKGDWTETDVFYRGAGDVIGATKMDDALLKELQRQEEVLSEDEDEEELDDDVDDLEDNTPGAEADDTEPPERPKPSGGGSLFDYDMGDDA